MSDHSEKFDRAARLRELREFEDDLLSKRRRHETLVWVTRGHYKNTAPSSPTSRYSIRENDDGSYVVKHIEWDGCEWMGTVKDGLPSIADAKLAAQADHDALRADIVKRLRADLAYLDRVIAGIGHELDSLREQLVNAEIERDDIQNTLDDLTSADDEAA
jgi:hypothetical protein